MDTVSHHAKGGSRLKFAVLSVCVVLAVHGLLRMFPDTVVLPLFCRVPAGLAAWYYNAVLEKPELLFSVRGVTFEVARSCAATDFFSMVTGLLVYGVFIKVAQTFLSVRNTSDAQTRMSVPPSALLSLAVLPVAWCVTIFTNTIRLIFLVPATAFMYRYFPEWGFAASHQAIGTVIFLTSFILLWKGIHYVTRKSAT